jgi:hypothetical protein
MARMPSLLRSAVLGLLLVAVFALTAMSPGAGVAQAGVSVHIQPPGDAAGVAVGLDQLSEADFDIREQTYQVAKASGGVREVTVTRGVSLVRLFQLTNTDFNYATVLLTRRNGTDIELSREQVKKVGELVFYVDPEGKTFFIGPKQSNGIVAHRDYFEASPLNHVVQRAESKLKVEISPSRKKIEPGGTITFEATVTGEEPGETVTYKWWLNGKVPRSGESTHIQDFPEKDGVYEVSVSARVGSNPSVTAVAKITVGDPDKADEEELTTDTQGTTPGGTGNGSSTYDPSYTPTPAAPVTPTPPPTPEPTDLPDIATTGTPVEGNLLADASDAPPSNLLESAAQAASEGKQRRKSSADGAGVPEAALSIAGVLALLGLGAGIESRQGRLPRLRLPRRAA